MSLVLILSHLREIRANVRRIESRLNSAQAAGPRLMPYSVKEFAGLVGRGQEWVSDRCRAGVIKTCPGGKPYRIPATELSRWIGGKEVAA